MSRGVWRGLTLLLLFAGAIATAAGPPAAPSRIPDFTFIHCSDTHVPPGVNERVGPPEGPRFGTAEVIAQIKSLREPIRLAPYDVTVPPPSFAVVTGDLTEFGGLNGWWEQYLGLWEGVPFPVYHISGNHDSTWACQRFNLRRLYGQPFYSFDYGGCHFIAWDSATPQDPRPSFGEELFRWLQEDLRRVPPETPVFLFCHHPLDSTEFASPYERDRLLDLLRRHNLALLLVGHGHTARANQVAGIPQVMGGATFRNRPGYNVLSVKDGILYVAYRVAWEPEPSQPLLKLPLPRGPRAPEIRIVHPRDGQTVRRPLRLVATIARTDIVRATWQADDARDRQGDLRRVGDRWEATIPADDWEPGAHYLRLVFTTASGETFPRSVRCYLPGERVEVMWRTRLGGNVKGAPAIDGDLLVLGAADGVIYGLDRTTGRVRWRVRTGGEILARPLALHDQFILGSGDGKVYAIGRRGRVRWTHDVGYPVYSAAAYADGKIVVAANDGRIYALDPATGERRWECREPRYAIESAPFVAGSTVYYGAWDTFVYAIDATTGACRWKAPGAGSAASAPGVARYYSPADAAPVVAGGRVWIADRMYRLTIFHAATGEKLGERSGVSSVALAADGRAVYLRGTDGWLRKVDLAGRELWSAPARTGALPTAAVEADGVVYTISGTGLLTAWAAADGRPLWEYQLTPRLYVFADPVVADGVVYGVGTDGVLTAVRARRSATRAAARGYPFVGAPDPPR